MRDSGHCVTAHLSQGSREVTQCLEQAMREILYSYSPFLAFLSPPIFCALSWGPQLPYGFDLLETHDSARYESLSESLQIPHAPPPDSFTHITFNASIFRHNVPEPYPCTGKKTEALRSDS